MAGVSPKATVPPIITVTTIPALSHSPSDSTEELDYWTVTTPLTLRGYFHLNQSGSPWGSDKPKTFMTPVKTPQLDRWTGTVYKQKSLNLRKIQWKMTVKSMELNAVESTVRDCV